MNKMLTSEHKRTVSDIPSNVMLEYEAKLIDAVADSLSSLETFSPQEINGASMALRSRSIKTYLSSVEPMSQIVAQSLKAGFEFNALLEVA